MKIEVLYGEICNLYGDLANVEYLSKIKDDVTIVETSLKQRPKFLDEEIDLVYMGSCPFLKEELIISQLLPYKKEIEKKILENQLFLVTGTTCEIFGQYILEQDTDKRIKGLGIFDYYSYRFKNRHNSFFLGEFQDFKIVGNKDQFFFLKDVNAPFIKVIKGYGNNPDDIFEGLAINQFYLTSLLGPFLILNPPFTKYLLSKKYSDTSFRFEKEAYEAYQYRLNDLEKDDARILMGDHG